VITDVPAVTPVTTPVEAFMVATPVVALLQVPPEVEFPRVVVNPAQTDRLPVMAAKTGNGFTVTVAVTVRVQLFALVTE